jgi:hypothetical protein
MLVGSGDYAVISGSGEQRRLVGSWGSTEINGTGASDRGPPGGLTSPQEKVGTKPRRVKVPQGTTPKEKLIGQRQLTQMWRVEG